MASLAIVLKNKTTPIDPTIPGTAITLAGYPGEVGYITLIAYADNGSEVTPPADDISWSIQNTSVATLSVTKGMTNTVIHGPIKGSTTITVTWKSRNLKGLIKVITVLHTETTTITYDDGSIKGQVIKIVTEPTAPSPTDPAGSTKIYVAGDSEPNIAEINSTTGQSKVNYRGSIIRMTDAMSITGDGLLPVEVNSNVGDPIEVRKTLRFLNRTLNVPIQVTIRVIDYFDIYTEFGPLKNFNFIVQPKEEQVVEYGINKDTVKLLMPTTHTSPVKINMVSFDSGQIFLD